MIVPSEKVWAKELDKICRITEYEAKPEHCELFRLFRIMKVHPSKIGLGGSQPIRIMDLHGTAEQVASLVDGERYFPGWHMNRKYWYTICMDGSVPMDELQRRIDASFALSQPKKRR